MSIVAPTDFIGEQNIPNTDSPVTAENLQWFIDEYEPMLMKAVFGETLYDEYLVGVAIDPPVQKWQDLKNNADLKRAIVCCVYYYFVSDQNTYQAGIGTQKPTGENSNNASSWDKLVKAWNTMVGRNYKVRKFIDEGDYEISYSDLPQYVWELPFVNCVRPPFFVYKNTLNL